ncbi:MAG TPA: ABC transporter substrate-binding protein [Stellaceae bacterium]|nr:ABC transporter substrate-binding protein [Stellaceae bacterium]
MKSLLTAAIIAATVAALPLQARAEDEMKVAVGQRGNWDTSVCQLGQDAGIFKKHGLKLDILYTAGGGETIQAVVSGSADAGMAVGTLGVIGAYAKGAPIRIIQGQATGTAEFWYVRADNKLKTLKDAMPETTLAFSTAGSSTNEAVLGLSEVYGIKPKLVPTGNPPTTFTAVMSGQIDVGWASPPFGFKQLDAKQIRIVAHADDVPSLRNETIRVNISNTNFVTKHKDVLDRFRAAYIESLNWMYSSDAAVAAYVKFAKSNADVVKRLRTEYITKAMEDPTKFSGTETLMKNAIRFKMLDKPLTDAQLKELVQIPGRS